MKIPLFRRWSYIKKRFLVLLFVIVLFCGCSKKQEVEIGSDSLIITDKYSLTNDIDIDEPEPNVSKNEEIQPKPLDEDMVLITDFIPDIVVDLRYSTSNNFTGQIIYDDNKAYLRYGTIKKLIEVQEKLKDKGYGIVVWDAYRPVSAQYKLWEICPNSTYVANPNKGFSSHSRGNTIDMSIIGIDGKEVNMPTDFDDFSERASRSYLQCTKDEKNNALLLERIMIEAGFEGYQNEWWHYSDIVSYGVVEEY